MDTSNITIERAHRVGEKSNDKERTTVVQFSFYKDKTKILRNCKKLKGTEISIFPFPFPFPFPYSHFSQETMQARKEKWKEVLANRKQGKISYLQYRSVICKEGRTPA